MQNFKDEMLAAFEMFVVTNPNLNSMIFKDALKLAYLRGRTDSCDAISEIFNTILRKQK